MVEAKEGDKWHKEERETGEVKEGKYEEDREIGKSGQETEELVG